MAFTEEERAAKQKQREVTKSKKAQKNLVAATTKTRRIEEQQGRIIT